MNTPLLKTWALLPSPNTPRPRPAHARTKIPHRSANTEDLSPTTEPPYTDGMIIQVVDLFSGIGMFSEGLRRANPDAYRTIALCESRPYRRQILAHHHPGVQIYSDVRTLDPESIDHDPSLPVLVCGGPPCQSTSTISAISGSRSGGSLASHQIRTGDGLSADWIVLEQPPGHALWEIRTAQSLADLGYHVGRLEFAASDLGAPYQRRRVFLLACAELRGLEVAVASASRCLGEVRDRATAEHTWDPSIAGVPRVDDGYVSRVDAATGVRSRDRRGGSQRQDRIEALGDSCPPQMYEVIGRAILASYRPPQPEATLTMGRGPHE